MRDRLQIDGASSQEKYSLVVWESVLCDPPNPELAVLLSVKNEHRAGPSVHVAAKDAELFALEILATLKDIGYEFGGES